MKIIKNLVRADREGDFLLYMNFVQKLCLIFMLRFSKLLTLCNLLLKNLKSTIPELYSPFMVINRKNVSFNTVGGDMALKQTIMRSSKSTEG